MLATALVSIVGTRPNELSFEQGDLLEVQKDLGQGVVYGANVSQGSVAGVFLLRNIELNLQTQILEATQRATEELMLAKRELEDARLRRETLQGEVAMMRDAKEDLVDLVNPHRFGVRSMDDFLLHLTQTDIECVEIAELIREVQNDWTAIISDINRLQANVDDPELDPFRRLVLDRCDVVKKRLPTFAPHAAESIQTFKLVHTDLENLTNAIQGLPLQQRPSRTGTEHARTSSQGSSNPMLPLSPTPSSMNLRGHISTVSQSGAHSPAHRSPFTGSLGTLPEFTSSSAMAASGSGPLARNGQITVSTVSSPSGSLPSSSTLAPLSISPSERTVSPLYTSGSLHGSSSDISTDSGGRTPISSPSPNPLDRATILAGQRSQGSSSSLFGAALGQSSGLATARAPPSSGTTSPPVGPSKFVLGTKPGSIRSEYMSSSKS